MSADRFRLAQTALHEASLTSTCKEAAAFLRESIGADELELAEWLGDGPLRPLLADPSVTEILVNGPSEIWAERAGRLERVGAGFTSEETLRAYLRRQLARAGRKLDLQNPFVDCALPCGTRLHAAGPPVARAGLCLSLRKFRAQPWRLADLRESGSLNERATDYLRNCVHERRNLFLSGGTGTGKTTLLGALVAEIPAGERVIALEDVSEIRAAHPHFISLEARPANQEGEGEIPLRRLLKESLRMRPDRLLIGECRGSEALDLLLALNSGHGGSMGTVHAASPREALHRLEALALLGATNLTENAMKALVPGAVHVLVQLGRRAGWRGITAIAELKGVDGGRYLLREVPI